MVTGQPLLIVWEICPSMSVRMKILLVSWIVSTETDPKAGGESPPGTSSWFLHQLTRFILNQLKASLKHLTFKTVFLLALGSGKRRSEIHAWQNRNIRHQSDWSKVSLYPSPSFLSKNQLAKEGPDSVAPGVITASSLTGPSVQSEHCATFYCEKYTYHFLTIAICWCHPTHWPTLRNVLRYLKRPVSKCELACPPSGHVTTLVNNLHYFCWPS